MYVYLLSKSPFLAVPLTAVFRCVSSVRYRVSTSKGLALDLICCLLSFGRGRTFCVCGLFLHPPLPHTRTRSICTHVPKCTTTRPAFPRRSEAPNTVCTCASPCAYRYNPPSPNPLSLSLAPVLGSRLITRGRASAGSGPRAAAAAAFASRRCSRRWPTRRRRP